MALEWKDTGIEVPAPPQFVPKKSKAGLPIYPQEMTNVYTSDYDVLVIPSPDGNPARQRILYVVSGTKGKIRHISILEIPPGGGLLLSKAPPELSAPGANEIEGQAVQPRFVAIEVQRPGRGPEYQARLMCVKPRPDNSAWTLVLVWSSATGDLPFWWPRRLPGQ